jgi:hypothetical protein
MDITPPHKHAHLELLLSAGILPIKTVGEPGAQGATVFGIQGIGVNTPKAAAVAEATVGLAKLVHTPKVGILTIGLESMMVAAGGPPVITILLGMILNGAGAAPKVHCIKAPAHTCTPIVTSYLFYLTTTATG